MTAVKFGLGTVNVHMCDTGDKYYSRTLPGVVALLYVSHTVRALFRHTAFALHALQRYSALETNTQDSYL